MGRKIRLSGKKNPRLLFLLTASSDSKGYFADVSRHFGDRLGCEVSALYLLKNKYSQKQIEKIILSADIIYVGGGNTLKMMTAWRKYGVDKILHKAWKKGVIISGVSAGSICWFKYGNSDSRKFKNKDAGMIKVSGLGFINALHCTHYNIEPGRKESLKKIMKKTQGIAIALDNCCALEIVDDKYRIITSRKNAKAYKVYWRGDCFYELPIKEINEFQDISELLRKNIK